MESKLNKELHKFRKDKETLLENDSVVVEGNALLLHAKEEDIEILETLNLTHSIDIRNKKIFIEEKISYFKNIFDTDNIFSGTEIKTLCNKYFLQIIHTSYYKGKIPSNLGAKIKEFTEKNNIKHITENDFLILAPVEDFCKEQLPFRIRTSPILFYREGNTTTTRICPAKTTDVFIEIYNWGNIFSSLRQYLFLFDRQSIRYKKGTNNSKVLYLSLAFFIFSILLGICTAFMFSTLFTIAGILLLSTFINNNTQTDKQWNHERSY